MKCENCGKEIDRIVTSFFDVFGSDHDEEILIEECDKDAVYFDVDHSWCCDELSEDEQHEDIRCPYCGKPPFKNPETQIYRYIRVVKFKDVANTNKGDDNIEKYNK